MAVKKLPLKPQGGEREQEMSDDLSIPVSTEAGYGSFVNHLEKLTQLSESMGHFVLAARAQAALDELRAVIGES